MDGEKICNTCLATKPYADFSKYDAGRKYRNKCKVCEKEGKKHSAEMKKRELAEKGTTHQKCNVCDLEKPISSFQIPRRTCVTCRNNQASARNMLKVEENGELKLCTGCSIAKPFDAFKHMNSRCNVCCAKGVRCDHKRRQCDAT